MALGRTNQTTNCLCPWRYPSKPECTNVLKILRIIPFRKNYLFYHLYVRTYLSLCNIPIFICLLTSDRSLYPLLYDFIAHTNCHLVLNILKLCFSAPCNS